MRKRNETKAELLSKQYLENWEEEDDCGYCCWCTYCWDADNYDDEFDPEGYYADWLEDKRRKIIDEWFQYLVSTILLSE